MSSSPPNRFTDQQIQNEMRRAANYVSSTLPGDLDGHVQVSSAFLPNRVVGGDCFDYRWIDDDHLIVYLADVSGHDLESTLVAVSVHNMIRSGSLPKATLLKPDRVLSGLNRRFQMESNHGHFLTMWFGVYQRSTRTMTYASAGHPPAVIFTGSRAPIHLDGQSQPLGMFADNQFGCHTLSVPPGAEMILCTDGAFEMPLHDGEWFDFCGYVDVCAALIADLKPDGCATPRQLLNSLVDCLRNISATGDFRDDCTLIWLRLP